MIFQDEIIGHAEFLDGAFAHALFGDVGLARLRCARPGEAWVTSFPLSSTLPWRTGRSPARHSASSRCPLPETPARPRISPARTLKRYALAAHPARGRRGIQVLALPGRPRRPASGGRSYCRITGRPTIIWASSACGGASRSGSVPDHPPIAQHGDPVADRQHFVQLVRDKDQRMADLAPSGGRS